jgi:hypothetical protein
MGTARIANAARAALLVCAVTAGAGVAAPLRAEADVGKAWAAAKDNLPAGATMVIGADVAAITKSQLFGSVLPLVLSQQADAKQGFDLLKSSCKVDPLAAIQGIVLGTDADQKQGAVYIQLGGGMDAGKLTKCLEEVVKAKGPKDAKLSVKKTGAITELAVGSDKIYLSWFGTDVLAIPVDIKDKSMLEKWTGQKGALAKGSLGKLLAAVNTKATLWGASSASKELDPGVNMKGAHGALTAAGGKLALDLRVILENAKQASDAVAKATAGISQAASAGALAPNIKAMLQQISVKAAGPEVSVKVSVPEADLIALVGSFLGP